jgi:hypothetical protein
MMTGYRKAIQGELDSWCLLFWAKVYTGQTSKSQYEQLSKNELILWLFIYGYFKS